ncbi:MAG: hypothetical protein ACTHMC_12470 [Pseudobacter sp.]|uniref:hypothetical protein n=1 Tax=Pseudobacter sp. TaxID=2045420 RepID=UPI003F81B179
MKFLRFTLVFGLIAFLISCYEVNEEVVINENGSGVYESRMDLSQLIELMQSFAGEEEMTKGGLDKVYDTVISMQSFLDSADEATVKANGWMKDGKIAVKMNIKEKLFKINLNVPYQNLEQLQSLMEGQGALMKDSFTGLMNKGSKEKAPKDSSEAVFQDIVSLYKVTLDKGLIKKELDAEKYRSLMERPQAGDVKQMANSGMEIIYTSSFKLPGSVKNVSNPLLKVSEDKRTVTVRYNLLDVINDPAKYAFTIEY